MLKERVTIRKNQSALVPILQTDIAAEKVSLWSESLGVARPLRALWVNNASPLTLDGGSFSVLDSNTFAGEGLVEAIKPGEKRLLSYATDLGLLVDTKLENARERVTRVRIYRGTMTTPARSARRKRTSFEMKKQRHERWSLSIRRGRSGSSAKTAQNPRRKRQGCTASVECRSKKTERLVVNEAKPLYSQYELNVVTNDQIEFLLRQRSINAESRRRYEQSRRRKKLWRILMERSKSCRKRSTRSSRTKDAAREHESIER